MFRWEEGTKLYLLNIIESLAGNEANVSEKEEEITSDTQMQGSVK